MEIVLGMSFLALSYAKIQFKDEILTWKFYATTKALLIAKQIELIKKHKFAYAALAKNFETLVIYIIDLETSKSFMRTHSFLALLLATL